MKRQAYNNNYPLSLSPSLPPNQPQPKNTAINLDNFFI